MTGAQIVERYFTHHYRVIFWKDEGAAKGPVEKDWPSKQYTLEQYLDGRHRVGLLLGVEIAPGKFLHDVDIDWGEGSRIAQKILPTTDFIYGRASKPISHCFYTATEALPSYRYDDIDGTTLIEIRGCKKDGTLGYQTMVPPSIWESKEGDRVREPLVFRRSGEPAHLEGRVLKQAVGMSAIAMLLAKHLGHHGFGHEPRLAWAGFLLRLGFTVDELVLMGEAISVYCSNTEVADVRTVLQSTANRLNDPKQRIKGGPSLAKYLGERGKAVLTRIYEWLGKDSDFVRNKDGAIFKDSQDNVRRALELLDISLTYNQFSDRLLINGEHLEDKQMTDLWFRIDQEFHFRPTFEFFDKVVRHTAWEHAFHPVRQYLDSLEWDGEPRIGNWLTRYGGAEDNEYTRVVSAMVLVAAVRRIRSPGCKFDEMLVLESRQGMSKSSALRVLCPRGEWFSDDLPLNVRSQQLIEGTLGKWIVEAADMAGKRKTEVEQLKAMLSRQVDGPARMAYARLPVERPRQFIIVGTTNSTAYLTDPTGARRFWPVKIKGFDVAGLGRVRDQLWAEAARREAEGESIRLPERLWAAAGEEQEARREVDAWEDVLAEALQAIKLGADGKRRIATSTIWEFLGFEVQRRDRFGALRIAEIMHRFGFVRTRLWLDGKTVVGYESEAEGLNFVGEAEKRAAGSPLKLVDGAKVEGGGTNGE